MTGMHFKETQKEYYDRRWNKENSRAINQHELKRLISILQMIDKIKRKGEIKILDVGCGRGWLSSILSHIGTTTGIELSSKAVFAARQRYSYVDFRDGDLFSVLNETDTYDMVVSQEVIEHVEDQLSFLNLIANSMKLGGHLILTSPNAWALAHRSQEELKKMELQPIENWIDRKQLKQLLSTRFEVIEISSIIDGSGTTGIFRIMNSYKLRKLLNCFRLSRLFSHLLLKLDFGLHLVALARRRI